MSAWRRRGAGCGGLFKARAARQAANSAAKAHQFAPLAWHRPLSIGAMDLKLQPFDFAQAAARAGLGVNGRPLVKGAEPGTGFQGALTQALQSVSSAQNDAVRLQREVQLDNPAVSIEQTMVAMQKAQIGFQATLTIRNKLVQAYTDIMNMSV